MENKNIENIIESILFVSGEPVKIKQLADILKITTESIEEAVMSLKENKYGDGSGIVININGDEISFSTSEFYIEYITEYFSFDKRKDLTASALEVLSIIAYKQPITKTEIDNIRGVKSDYIINKLLDEDFIYISDRLDAPGLPNLYSTTNEFLRKFNVNSLEDLPKIEIEGV